MINCIVFDMDDTLYDEQDYYKSGFATVSRIIAKDFELADRKVFDCLWQIFNCGNRTNTFDAAAEKLGVVLDAGYIQKLVGIFRSHQPDINLPSDSKAVLENLKGRYKLGLITDGYLPAQQLKVKALGIEKYFDSIIYTETLGRENWKPAPAGFKKLLTELDLPADQCVYIGDNLEKDFLSPNQMGFKTIRVIRKGRIHFGPAPSAQAGPSYEVSSITEVINLLREIDAV
ncbi:MAG: HAD family hydrolase [Phycisphaerae bacterium]|nr:HAD family hydrolase [Phycisphaerae bacterium]